ncbi:alpha-amylase [Aspergillus sclerotialis]|uniref:alpha-amylase n=1 Tax=Aspergillus sclerotialis TaxID=2070753 RepID=A0A3A2ZJ48_9EURO|nr:alpha-amylase [Aspergillus sclerotialis]
MDRFAKPRGSPDSSCDLYKYCGGSWTGLIDHLDYIQDLGFTAILISPVVENIPNNTKYGEAYHGYWPNNMYSLNEHFGKAEDLQGLASELHKRDMYLMVDVVINDMAQAIHGTMADHHTPTIDWSRLIPFNEEKYYHSYCNITNWADPKVYQNCWFGVDPVALPDLKTEDDTVVSMIQEWVSGLVGNYSIDGLRIDATKHVDDAYLAKFTEASGVFTMGEVYSGDTRLVYRYEDLVTGLLNFPIYFPIIQAFTAGDMPGLADKVRTVQQDCKDFTRLGTFVENQDLPRFASLIDDITLAKNAMAFNILSDGIPIGISPPSMTLYNAKKISVLQGQEQHMSGNYSPYNRAPLWTTGYNTEGSLYTLTATLNRLRNHALRIDNHYASSHSQELYIDGSTYATRKGPEGVQIVSVFSNQGSKGGKYQLALQGGFAPGMDVMEILGCTRLTSNEVGNITVEMGAGEPKVFFPISQLNGSGLCGFKSQKKSSNFNSGHERPESAQKSSADHNLVYLYMVIFYIAFAAIGYFYLA